MVRARTWSFAIVLLFLSSGLALGGLSDEDTDAALSLSLLVALLLYVLTYLWMKADARERSTPSPPGAAPLIVAMYPLAIPYHLLATRRGWRRGAALLQFLCFVVVAVAVQLLAAEAARALASR